MKILIAGALDPYDNRECKSLCEMISLFYKECGHDTDVCYLPFKMDYHGVNEQILAYRLITTYPESDMLITVGYPAFALKHPNKYAFFLEFLPEFHVNYNTEYGFMEQWYRVQKDQDIKNNLLRTESICLKECKSVYCFSKYLSEEIRKIGCDTRECSFLYSADENNDIELEKNTFVTESYLNPGDRIDLLLKGFQEGSKDIRLSIFVPDAEECYVNALDARIHRLSLNDRVSIIRGSLSVDSLHKSRGVICLRRYAGHVPTFVSCAAEMNVACVLPSDGGALCEISQGNNISFIDPKSAIIASSLSKIHSKNVKKVKKTVFSQEMKDILEGMVK